MGTSERSYASKPIARELGERLRIVFGLGSAPATLGDLSAALGPLLATLNQEQLCAADASRHEVRTGTNTLYMNCVMDALIWPFLTGQPADIRSTSPLTGAFVTVRVASGTADFTPAEAVVSFGVSREISEAGLDAICPYINAFPTAAEYQQWAATTPAGVTMMLSLTDALALAREAASHVQ